MKKGERERYVSFSRKGKMEEEKRGFALFFFSLSLCLKCGKERDEIGRQ